MFTGWSELSFEHLFTSENISQLNDLGEKLEKKFSDFIVKLPEYQEMVSNSKDLECGVGNTVISITPT